MLELRDQYVTRFGAFPAVAMCDSHDGEFDPGEIARLGAQRTPAVYVACMRVGDVLDESGETAAILGWVAMIVTRGPDAVRLGGYDSAGDVASALALRIVAELNEGAVFPAARTRPEKVRARNLFGSTAAKNGYRLWAVSWDQATTIRPDELEPVLHDYLLQHTEYPNLHAGDGEPTAADVAFEAP